VNKTAIKNFAIWARNKLIADISYKASLLGITDKEIHKPTQAAQGVEFYSIEKSGTRQYEVKGKEIEQRRHLADKIAQKARESDYTTAYKAVIEEVAYTWFNRLIAVRFMEVNDYLPSRIRVLSSATGKTEPDIVTTPFDTDLEFTQVERDYIIACKTDNKLDELFRMLFIKQCNALNALLPELFERIDDYTELLLNISFTDKDGVVWSLINDITEADFGEAVEIIGWLYQYYNTEPKDETFALLKKNVKITKERIPAATQLFTPDWIVRYMVENSLGRLWLEGHPNDALKANWKYYLDEAEQTPEVQVQLEKIRAERRGQSPEDITFIDPCMGSGHILVYAFDVFMQIYESAGYSQRDATRLILEKNIHGLDIDKRAYQLAYFALFMKARQYNRRIFDASIAPQVYHPAGWSDGEEYGSLVKVDDTGKKPEPIIGQQNLFDEDYEAAIQVWNFKQLLSQKYDVVCTNPPYMGNSGMNNALSHYIKDNYPDTKSDLFAVYIEKLSEFSKPMSFIGLMTSYTWMFLSSYERLREKVLLNKSIYSLVQPEYHAFFEEAYVPICTFVLRNINMSFTGEYINLQEFYGAHLQEPKFLEAAANNNCAYRYSTNQSRFFIIPGSPIAYWMSTEMLESFKNGNSLNDFAPPKQGLITGDNDLFLKFWHEVLINKIALARDATKRWYPINKGGEFRRWYGNQEYIVDWEDNGSRIKNFKDANGKLKSRPQNLEYNFIEALSWSLITSSTFSVRYYPDTFTFNVAGISCFPKSNLYYLLGLLNTKIAEIITKIINPTLNMNVGDVAKVPVIIHNESKPQVNELVTNNILVSKKDWDSFETSWDFKRHPLV